MSAQSHRIISRAASATLRRRPAVATPAPPSISPLQLASPQAALTSVAPLGPCCSHYHTTTPSRLSDSEGPKTKQLKVKKKEKKSAKKVQAGGRDRALDLLIRAIDAPVAQPPPASAEEMQRRFDIGRAYNIGTSKRHNKLNHDLNCKLRMKQHAIDMLPRDSVLREEALKIDEDDDGPPMWRHVPVWTPPIPGFDPSQFVTDEEE